MMARVRYLEIIWLGTFFDSTSYKIFVGIFDRFEDTQKDISKLTDLYPTHSDLLNLVN